MRIRQRQGERGCTVYLISEMFVTGVQKQCGMLEAHACQIFAIKECVSGKDREKEGIV